MRFEGPDLPDPRPGQLWKHFRGTVYRVLALSRHTETMEGLVVYQVEDNKDEMVWARPLSMWSEKVPASTHGAPFDIDPAYCWDYRFRPYNPEHPNRQHSYE